MQHAADLLEQQIDGGFADLLGRQMHGGERRVHELCRRDIVEAGDRDILRNA